MANRAINGDLSLGPSALRAEVCDRAARANASDDEAARPGSMRPSAFENVRPSLNLTRDLSIVDAVLKEAEGLTPMARFANSKRGPIRKLGRLSFNCSFGQRGDDAAFSWVRAEGLVPADFQVLGAMNYLLKEIQQGEFDLAVTHLAGIPRSYYDQCPALHLLSAQLTLASILPEDQRAYLFQALPLNPKALQLASGPSGQVKIRANPNDLHPARQDSRIAGRVFGWIFVGAHLVASARRRRYTSCRASAAFKEITDPDKTLRLVRLALAYDVPFNQEALQRHLTARKELGGWTADERFAAFLMAYHSGDPKKLIEFFDKHHDDLFAQTDLLPSALAEIEIEVLARTGRFEDARRHIGIHAEKHLSADQVRDIERIVADIEKGDEVESLRQRYAETDTITNLRPLVAMLRTRRDHDLFGVLCAKARARHPDT